MRETKVSLGTTSNISNDAKHVLHANGVGVFFIFLLCVRS